MTRKKTAFTLIELLISITIISLLVTISIISSSEVRRNSKDAKRLNSVKQLQLALELYRRDIGAYPDTLDFGEKLTDPSNSQIIYLKKIPSNPKPESTEICPAAEYSYESDGKYYYLEFCLEKEKENMPAGYNCASFSGISSGNCPSL
jgi:prepilin-type N-terminal cleavage/methylation domain-containing protein